MAKCKDCSFWLCLSSRKGLCTCVCQLWYARVAVVVRPCCSWATPVLRLWCARSEATRGLAWCDMESLTG